MYSPNDDVVVKFRSVWLTRRNFTAWMPGARHLLSATLLHECLAPDTRSVQLYCMSAWHQTLAQHNFTVVWHTAKIRSLFCITKMAKNPSVLPLHGQNPSWRQTLLVSNDGSNSSAPHTPAWPMVGQKLIFMAFCNSGQFHIVIYVVKFNL